MPVKLTLQFDDGDAPRTLEELKKLLGQTGKQAEDASEEVDRLTASLKNAAAAQGELGQKKVDTAAQIEALRKERIELENNLKLMRQGTAEDRAAAREWLLILENQLARERDADQNRMRMERDAADRRHRSLRQTTDEELKAMAELEQAALDRHRKDPYAGASSPSTAAIDEVARRRAIADADATKERQRNLAEYDKYVQGLKSEMDQDAHNRSQYYLMIEQLAAEEAASIRKVEQERQRNLAEYDKYVQGLKSEMDQDERNRNLHLIYVEGLAEKEAAARMKRGWSNLGANGREQLDRASIASGMSQSARDQTQAEIDAAAKSEQEEADEVKRSSDAAINARRDQVVKEISELHKLAGEYGSLTKRKEAFDKALAEHTKNGGQAPAEFVAAYNQVTKEFNQSKDAIGRMRTETQKAAAELRMLGDTKGAEKVEADLEKMSIAARKAWQDSQLVKQELKAVRSEGEKAFDEAIADANRFSLSQERLLSNIRQVEQAIQGLERIKNRTSSQNQELAMLQGQLPGLKGQITGADAARVQKLGQVDTAYAGLTEQEKSERRQIELQEAKNRAIQVGARASQRASEDEIRAQHNAEMAYKKRNKAIIDGAQALLINNRAANEAFNAAQRFDDGGYGKLTVAVLAAVAGFKAVAAMYKQAKQEQLGLAAATGRGSDEFIRQNARVGTLASGFKSALREVNFMSGAVRHLSDAQTALTWSSLLPGNDMFASLAVGANQLAQDIVSLGGILDTIPDKWKAAEEADKQAILERQAGREAQVAYLEDMSKIEDAEERIRISRARGWAQSVHDLETLQSQYEQLAAFQKENAELNMSEEGRAKLHEAELQAAAVLDRIANDQAHLAGKIIEVMDSLDQVSGKAEKAYDTIQIGSTRSIEDTEELIRAYQHMIKVSDEGSPEQVRAVELLEHARDRLITQTAQIAAAEKQARQDAARSVEESAFAIERNSVMELKSLSQIQDQKQKYIDQIDQAVFGTKEHQRAIEGLNAATQREKDVLVELANIEKELDRLRNGGSKTQSDKSAFDDKVKQVKDLALARKELERAAELAKTAKENGDVGLGETAKGMGDAAQSRILELEQQIREQRRASKEELAQIQRILSGQVLSIKEQVDLASNLDELARERALAQAQFGKGSVEDQRTLNGMIKEYDKQLKESEDSATAIKDAIDQALNAGDVGEAERLTKELDRQKAIAQELQDGLKKAREEQKGIADAAKITIAEMDNAQKKQMELFDADAKQRRKSLDQALDKDSPEAAKKRIKDEISKLAKELANLQSKAINQVGDDLKNTVSMVEKLKAEIESLRDLEESRALDIQKNLFDTRVSAIEQMLSQQGQNGQPTLLQHLGNQLRPMDITREIKRRREEEINQRTQDFADANGLNLDDKQVAAFRAKTRKQVMNRDPFLERQDVMSDMVSKMVESAKQQGKISAEFATGIQKQIDKAKEQIDSQIALRRATEDLTAVLKGKDLKKLGVDAGKPPEKKPEAGKNNGGMFSVTDNAKQGGGFEAYAAGVIKSFNQEYMAQAQQGKAQGWNQNQWAAWQQGMNKKAGEVQAGLQKAKGQEDLLNSDPVGLSAITLVSIEAMLKRSVQDIFWISHKTDDISNATSGILDEIRDAERTYLLELKIDANGIRRAVDSLDSTVKRYADKWVSKCCKGGKGEDIAENQVHNLKDFTPLNMPNMAEAPPVPRLNPAAVMATAQPEQANPIPQMATSTLRTEEANMNATKQLAQMISAMSDQQARMAADISNIVSTVGAMVNSNMQAIADTRTAAASRFRNGG